MPTQIIIALCEGPHDVAFICKILKSSGFVSNETTKIREFPSPMAALMAQDIVKSNMEELNIQQIRQNVLPINTLRKEDNFVFLYSMGGDGKRNARQDILSKIKAVVREPGEIKKESLPVGTELSLVYFFDADLRGINTRLAEIIAEIRTIITTLPDTAFSANGDYGTYEGIKLGTYIFSGVDNNTGKLEDILIPIMKSGNDDIFDNAETYLNTHFDKTRTFPFKFTIVNNMVTENRSIRGRDTDFDRKKSIIGVTGQLQRSGKANTTYISDTDYLTLAKINSNHKCQDIITFFNNFMNNL